MRGTHALVALVLLILAGGVTAAEVLQATTCMVGADEVIEGNLLAVCRDLHIDGRVEGSVFGVALTAQISGRVEDDVYLLARGLEVTGSLGDDLHFAGGSLELRTGSEWETGGLVAAAVSITVEPETRIPDGVSALAYQLQSSGDIGGDMLYAGESLIIEGMVERDVFAHVGDTESPGASQLPVTLLSLILGLNAAPSGLRIEDDAQLGRHLDYLAPSQAEINGRVIGDITFTPMTDAPTIEELVAEESRGDALRQYFAQVVQDILMLTVMGAVLLLIVPGTVKRPARAVGERLIVNAALGVGTFVLSFPLLALMLAFSILILALLALLQIDALTLAVAVSLGLVNIGGSSLFYFICAYIARLTVAAAIGTLLLELVSAKDLTIRDWMLGVAVGAVPVALLTSLPTVGWIVNLIVIGTGLGAVLRTLWRATRSKTVTGPSPIRLVLAPSSIPLSPQLPPPLVEDTPPARGMDNLPPGFRWWDDE